MIRKLLIRSDRNKSRVLTDVVGVERASVFAGGITERNELYYADDKHPDHTLNLLRPAGKEQERLPLLIVIHGGGLVGGHKEINTLQSRYFAAQGFCVANLDYRKLPDVDYRGLVQDIFSACTYLAGLDTSFPFDRARVYMTGDSGGGHIVSVIGAVMHDPELQRFYGVGAPAMTVKKIALTCPMVGTESLVHPDSLAYRIFHAVIGKQQLSDTAVMQHASILNILKPELYPPVFLLTTPGDKNFYPDAQKLRGLLEARGANHQYKEYAGQTHKLGHVFNVNNPEWEESIEANRDIAEFFLK